MSNKNILRPVYTYIDCLQKKCLNDPSLRDQRDQDCIFISKKILSTNIIKMIRLVLCIMIFTYFIGQYWYIFSFNMYTYHDDHDHFLSNENWNIIEQES